MNENYKNLIYLLSCAVNGITPDTARVQTTNLEQLYRLAKFHSVRAAVYIALKRAGVQNKTYDQAYKKAVRKNIYLDMERSAIITDFEKNGIWYLPLKGSILKDLYPENGMREMSDNDILFDAKKQEQSREIMLSHGYTVEHYGLGYDDAYRKPPVLNIELHTALFGQRLGGLLHKYYADAKRLLQKDEGNNYGYHFSDEDFYIYMTAHEWKHYVTGGTGIRSLLDCYVYCKSKGDTLDWNYITEQCRILEIADYEQERRALALKVFSSGTLPNLSDSEQRMLMYYLTAGTYGTFENNINNKLKNRTKFGYALSQIFPSVSYMKESVKFVKKYPFLYPIGIVCRWGRILVKYRDKLKKTVNTVNKYGK